MNLVLIESPGKREKWQKSLGPGYRVMASMGHITELAKDGEDALGFDMTGDRINCRFIPRGSRGKQVIKDLKLAVRGAKRVLFATDPDREGEIISWHLARELGVNNPLRAVVSEITPSAIKKAIASPRPLDRDLVAAALGRTCLDKLVGFRGSKLVWSLNNGAKSVGRVQSATLHILCDREREIQRFRPEDYWSVWVDYAEGFRAFYAGNVPQSEISSETKESDDSSALPSTDSDRPSNPQDTNSEKSGDKVEQGERVLSQSEADRLVAIARSYPHQVASIAGKLTSKKPPAAFTTSSLQQAAGARLKWNPEKTMQVAQKLYEAGYITYMRTDSTALSAEFCAAVRGYLEQTDPDNVPDRVAKHKSILGAQEAHEAIRPTEVLRTPAKIKAEVNAEQAALYELIWLRAIAANCRNAELLKTKVITQSGSVYWQAYGRVLQFEGYLKYWRDLGSDRVLPTLQRRQQLTLKEAGADKKQTQPPPRYTEPKLIQTMERLGIGRPSTYAPTIKTLKARDYVKLVKSKLQPTQLGMEVDEFLGRALPELIQADFTAEMEKSLDAIASGNLDWQQYLTRWNREYFEPALKKARNVIAVTPQSYSPRPISESVSEPAAISCPNCGKQMVKVPSKSKKLKANHFLSCDKSQGGCGTVMFWNARGRCYELPYSQSQTQNQPQSQAQSKTKTKTQSKTKTKTKTQSTIQSKAKPKNQSTTKSKTKSKAKAKTVPKPQYQASPPSSCDLTTHACPVCGLPLEEYQYQDKKTGKEKSMLRCSNPQNRYDSCQKVAFFWTSRKHWWSPTFGEL